MRKLIKRYLPDHEAIHGNRWLAPFASTLLHPRLWHINRRSTAGAVAAGLFCGLIPGPFQMLGAALCCVIFRANLPLALLVTLYTNPLTIIPLYLLAWRIGARVLGADGAPFTPPPEPALGNLLEWTRLTGEWALGLGKPLGLGLLLLADLLAASGYLIVLGAWRLYLVRAWRRRQARGRARRLSQDGSGQSPR